jgi:hypothetical protein
LLEKLADPMALAAAVVAVAQTILVFKTEPMEEMDSLA